MPLLSVWEALDPLSLDSFVVTRTSMVVGSNGQAVLTPQTYSAYGVVTPAGSDLKRSADGSRLTGAIEVITRFQLTGGYKSDDVTSVPADVILWHGRNWTVAMVSDYSGFGRGYLRAQCDLLELMSTVQEPQQAP